MKRRQHPHPLSSLLSLVVKPSSPSFSFIDRKYWTWRDTVEILSNHLEKKTLLGDRKLYGLKDVCLSIYGPPLVSIVKESGEDNDRGGSVKVTFFRNILWRMWSIYMTLATQSFVTPDSFREIPGKYLANSCHENQRQEQLLFMLLL